MTKAQKMRRAKVAAAYCKTFNGVPVSVLDIPKIYQAIEEAIESDTLATTMPELLEKYGEVQS
jgi:hypothetical protein